MIIRRRHTANFTTIGNALFEDERLAADEVGVLAYLLSRPHDWEVRRPALMRRWKIGRDAIKRIMTNLIRNGWCVAHKTRLSNGTFHVIYEIRDEPGPELTEDEVRGALSLVSSEAIDADSEVERGPDHPGATGDPPTCQPGVADQYTVTRSWPIEDLQNPDSPRTESTQSARAFLDVRRAWPPEFVLSAVVCEELHAGLTDAVKEAAFQGIKPYLDDCRAQGRKVCDLSKFYRERRWERFEGQAPQQRLFVCRRTTPAETMRWRQWFLENEPRKLAYFDSTIAKGGGYTVPSQWPPRKSVGHDPPQPTMTQDDHDAVATL